MYLRAGVFSFGLLLLSRVLGLLRESAQAAAFGSTGMGDAVIVMFTLPDLLVGILVSGALSYVLLPAWAQQSPSTQAAGQKKVTCALVLGGLVLGLLVWLYRIEVVQALAPGLPGEMKAASASALGWSAMVLPMAMVAALWVARLQHEGDFVGMYAGNLIVNLVLVAGLFAASKTVADASLGRTLTFLGICLAIAMLARLAWLAWRLPSQPAAIDAGEPAEPADLPPMHVWLWAALSSGFLLALPLAARSVASGAGEGALASFNYAWKLIELPLVLAVQLVASLAFPAITRTQAGTPQRHHAVGLAVLIAWTLACAAVAIVVIFSLPIAGLLFGWGRMNAASLQVIGDWAAIGVWSLLPQALIAILLTTMATAGRMRVAVAVIAVGLAVLLLAGALGGLHGKSVMWLLSAVFSGMALVLMVLERQYSHDSFPYLACLPPLGVCLGLVALKPLFAGIDVVLALVYCALAGCLVMTSALLASPALRGLLGQKIVRRSSVSNK